jgi:transposase
MTERIIETIGCDLGDKWSEVSILTPRGELQRSEPVKTTRQAMTAFFTRPRTHVVIEVRTHSRGLSELLRQLGHKVTVANPRKLKLISQSNLKRDRKDAEMLARLGRANEELLSPVQHRGGEAQADLAVAKARDALGERLPACTAASFHRKARAHVPSALRSALESIFSVLEKLEQEIKAYDQLLERMAKRYTDVSLRSPRESGRSRP